MYNRIQNKLKPHINFYFLLYTPLVSAWHSSLKMMINNQDEYKLTLFELVWLLTHPTDTRRNNIATRYVDGTPTSEVTPVTITVRKQLLSITLLSTQDGGRHSGQGCLQRLFCTSMHVSNGYPRPSDSLQYVGFTGVMCWSVGLFSGRNRAV